MFEDVTLVCTKSWLANARDPSRGDFGFLIMPKNILADLLVWAMRRNDEATEASKAAQLANEQTLEQQKLVGLLVADNDRLRQEISRLTGQ